MERTKTCPKCNSPDIRLSARRGVVDYVLSRLLLKPLRCRSCRLRFYRFAKQIQLEQPEFNPPKVKVKAAPARIILILESDDSIRRLWRRFLERAGYRVIEISEASELIATLRAHPVDLLLAELPQISVSGLRQSHPYLRTIGISDDPYSPDTCEGSQVLKKPLLPEELLESVRLAFTDS